MGYVRVLIVLGLLEFISRSEGIIGYDCDAPTVNMKTLSLIDIKACETTIMKPVTTDVRIQLLQIAEYLPIKVIQCKIEIHRTVSYCDKHSHISTVTSGQIQYVQEISHEICQKIQDTNSYRTGNAEVSQLLLNATTSRSVTFAGHLDQKGNCVGTDYSDYYGSYNSVVVYGRIFISLQDYYTSANTEKNEIILRSGVRCHYTKGSCVDIEDGHTFWKLIDVDHTCKFDKYISVLFEGYGQKIVDEKESKNNKEIYTATKGEVTFALAITGAIESCGTKILRTEHPRLFIIDEISGHHYFKISPITTGNLEQLTFFNTKFVFFKQHLRNQIISIYNNIIFQQCKLENQVLWSLLAIADFAPAEFAFRLMKEAGYNAIVTGEVVRILKCIPVEVTLRKTQLCFQELPVHRGNERLFMLPHTHILVKTAQQIDCALAPMFIINNQWIQSHPQITTAVPPEVMSAEKKYSRKYVTPQIFAMGEIHSTEDLNTLREHMMFPNKKPAVLQTIARTASGRDTMSQGININSLIDENTIREKLNKAPGKVFGFFNFIETFSVTVFGAWVVVRGIKFIIDTLVHGYALHTVYGWHLYLFGDVWDSVTHLLLHLKKHAEIKKKSSCVSDVENQGEKGLIPMTNPQTIK